MRNWVSTSQGGVSTIVLEPTDFELNAAAGNIPAALVQQAMQDIPPAKANAKRERPAGYQDDKWEDGEALEIRGGDDIIMEI